MINEAYFVPLCLNYETVIEDALHRRTAPGEDISSRIEQLSTLRIYDPDHKRAKVMINFSNPISDNYRSLMVDRIFIQEKIQEQRRPSKVEVLSSVLLIDRFKTKSYSSLSDQFKEAAKFTTSTLHVSISETGSVEKMLKGALKQMTDAFDGILKFNNH